MRRRSHFIGAACLLTSLGVGAWLLDGKAGPRHFSEAEIALIANLSLSRLGPLPPDPSNHVANNPAAAALGRELFEDVRLSSAGDMACVSCHIPEQGFDDNALPGQGVGATTRRTMPLAGTAYSPWLFWDGRADSQWAQALGPLENHGEQATTRVAVTRLIASAYAEPYEALFGALPEVETLPAAASPLGTDDEIRAWEALGTTQQDGVNRVFSNVGKALAAFERTLAPARSRFDDFADALSVGEANTILSPLEQQGLAVFVGKGQCAQCHNGPLLTDNFFHNTGVPQAGGTLLDLGRLPAVAQVDADPFNCLGAFSDAQPDQCGELRFKATGDSLLGAFKTPSLRNVAVRQPFMHAGQFHDLESVVGHYNQAPWAVVGLTELHRPNLTAEEVTALVAFLKTL